MMGKELREKVRERYAEAARSVKGKGDDGGCCGSSCCGSEARKVSLTAGSYSAEELTEVQENAVGASLGCGNPTALATLLPGEAVLDLDSGGGIDVLLSARRVSPRGKVYGVGMTDEMLELARENGRKAGLGIDTSGQESETIDGYLAEPFDYVVTVCDDAKEACPVFPGAKNRLHWSFRDSSQATGSKEERQEGVFRGVRDEIRARIEKDLVPVDRTLLIS